MGTKESRSYNESFKDLSLKLTKTMLWTLSNHTVRKTLSSEFFPRHLIAMAADEEKAKFCIFQREGVSKWDFPIHCSYGPVGDDPFQWAGAIMGPIGTPYEDGVFFLSIELPQDYPYSPPLVKFLTKVYHPNIDEDGKVYMDILEEEWRPVFCMETIMLSVCSLLAEPNPVDPSNPSSLVYREDVQKFNEIARQWTIDFAI